LMKGKNKSAEFKERDAGNYLQAISKKDDEEVKEYP